MKWQKTLTKVFAGFSFHHNYPVGKYRADFLIKELGLALECNGFDNHVTYDQQKEAEREQFVNQRYSLVRFNHLINWEALANGILHAKVTAKNSPHKGRNIVVYDSKFIESLMRAYALAFVQGKLRKNQKHIGQRCVFLLVALVRTALEAAIILWYINQYPADCSEALY